MKIQESRENYLETILVLKQTQGAVRSIDIAQKLGFTKPSISRAMSLLRTDNLITMDKEGYIELTPEGKNIAGRIYERHQILTACFVKLGVTPETAADDACRVEHVISEELFEKIKSYANECENADTTE